MPDDALRTALQRHAPEIDAERVTLHTDTSDFYRVNAGDVVLAEGRYFLVGNNTREGRFGLDDEVKYWVKRGRDLQTGASVILKLEFHETFDANIGGVRFECFRSPMKESRILDMVADHPHFMHGQTLHDAKGNNIRVLDFIRGRTLSDHVTSLPGTHEEYFRDNLPGVLAGFLDCVRALRFLHERGEKHGDVRRDHVLIDSEDGAFRWIDFDYSFVHQKSVYAYDLYGLGNILIFLTGKGDVNPATLRDQRPEVFETLYWEDLNIVWQNRVANLRKVHPYIPVSLNEMLLHFANGANLHYETTDEFLADLERAAEDVGRATP